MSRMENNAASFGAADVVSEKVVNRWVMDFTPCVASDADLMSAWSSVKRGIEEVMLPDLNTMMVSGKGLSKHKKTFEDQTLRLDDDYTCIRQCVMVDPVGSSLQKSHVDISNSLLTKFIGSFNVWNVFIPVQVEPGHPETAVHHNSPPSQPLPNVNVGWDDVYFFDGMKTHYGRGNLHNKPRVLIHVVYVQTKLLQHPLGREEISQQFQKNGLFAHPEERNIFDRRTLVGSSGVADKLLELKIKRTVWEKNGGLSSDVSLSKKDNWNRYKPDKKRTRSSSKLR